MADLAEADKHAPPLAVRSTALLGPIEEAAETLRKPDLLLAQAHWLQAVAGRPLKNVAQNEVRGKRGDEKAASNTDLPLAAEGRTAQRDGGADDCKMTSES